MDPLKSRAIFNFKPIISPTSNNQSSIINSNRLTQSEPRNSSTNMKPGTLKMSFDQLYRATPVPPMLRKESFTTQNNSNPAVHSSGGSYHQQDHFSSPQPVMQHNTTFSSPKSPSNVNSINRNYLSTPIHNAHTFSPHQIDIEPLYDSETYSSYQQEKKEPKYPTNTIISHSSTMNSNYTESNKHDVRIVKSTEKNINQETTNIPVLSNQTQTLNNSRKERQAASRRGPALDGLAMLFAQSSAAKPIPKEEPFITEKPIYETKSQYSNNKYSNSSSDLPTSNSIITKPLTTSRVTTKIQTMDKPQQLSQRFSEPFKEAKIINTNTNHTNTNSFSISSSSIGNHKLTSKESDSLPNDFIHPSEITSELGSPTTTRSGRVSKPATKLIEEEPKPQSLSKVKSIKAKDFSNLASNIQTQENVIIQNNKVEKNETEISTNSNENQGKVIFANSNEEKKEIPIEINDNQNQEKVIKQNNKVEKKEPKKVLKESSKTQILDASEKPAQIIHKTKSQINQTSKSLQKLYQLHQSLLESPKPEASKEWTGIEVAALYAIQNNTDINKPDIWQYVSDQMKARGYNRSKDECSTKWHAAVLETHIRKEKTNLKKKDTQVKSTMERYQAFATAQSTFPITQQPKRPLEESQDNVDNKDTSASVAVKKPRLGKQDFKILAEQSMKAKEGDDLFNSKSSSDLIARGKLTLQRIDYLNNLPDINSPELALNSSSEPSPAVEGTKLFQTNHVHKINTNRIKPMLVSTQLSSKSKLITSTVSSAPLPSRQSTQLLSLKINREISKVEKQYHNSDDEEEDEEDDEDENMEIDL